MQLSIPRNPTAPTVQESPGAPEPAPHRHQPRRLIPATFPMTPRRHCTLTKASNLMVGPLPSLDAGRKKHVPCAHNSGRFGKWGAVVVPPPGCNFDMLRVPFMRVVRPAEPTRLACPMGNAEKYQQDPKMASDQGVGGKDEQKEGNRTPQ